MVVVGAAPAAHPVVAQAVCVVEVHPLSQQVEPDVHVLPEEDGGGHCLLLDFHRLLAVLHPVVLAPADGLGLPYSVEGENLLVAVEAVQHPCDGAGLEHGAAPPHHPCGRPDVLADLQEGLVVVPRRLEDGKGMGFPEPPGIFGGVGELQRRVPINVHQAGISQGLGNDVRRDGGVLAAGEGDDDVFLWEALGGLADKGGGLVLEVVQAVQVGGDEPFGELVKESGAVILSVLLQPCGEGVTVCLLECPCGDGLGLSFYIIAAVLAPHGLFGQLVGLHPQQQLQQKPLLGKDGPDVLGKVFGLAATQRAALPFVHLLDDRDAAPGAPVDLHGNLSLRGSAAPGTLCLVCLDIALPAPHGPASIVSSMILSFVSRVYPTCAFVKRGVAGSYSASSILFVFLSHID